MNIILKIKWEKVFSMFLDKYLNSTYLDLVYSNYEEDYINLLDEDNFNKVYILLKNNNFYFIDDIILNYLELFEIEEKYVQLAINKIKSILGDNFVEQIGKNMTLINKIIELAISYSEKDNTSL